MRVVPNQSPLIQPIKSCWHQGSAARLNTHFHSLLHLDHKRRWLLLLPTGFIHTLMKSQINVLGGWNSFIVVDVNLTEHIWYVHVKDVETLFPQWNTIVLSEAGWHLFSFYFKIAKIIYLQDCYQVFPRFKSTLPQYLVVLWNRPIIAWRLLWK